MMMMRTEPQRRGKNDSRTSGNQNDKLVTQYRLLSHLSVNKRVQKGLLFAMDPLGVHTNGKDKQNYYYRQ